MLHGKPPVSARYMIKPRCLIIGHGSTGSFPGDFAELGKWFRQPSAGVGVPRSFAVRQHRGNAHSITKTERCRSANLLQMTRGLMCKLRQRGQGYGGRRPAGSRRIDPSLQPPPSRTAPRKRLTPSSGSELPRGCAASTRSRERLPKATSFHFDRSIDGLA